MPDGNDKQIKRSAFWSGSITFGLVSIPVALVAGSRSRGVRLRMLAPDGTPLSRVYYCPREDRPVEKEEIIRGYEIENDRFVTVTDDELDALQPKKSREIDLRRFVPADHIDPRFFDRAYFLVPTGDTRKPYKLLAETMEKTGRAGIATFVMRGKEYLVAILSENGILRAETLRFAEEIRPPEEAGLVPAEAVPGQAVDEMIEAIRAAGSDHLDMGELGDDYAEKLRKLVEQKRAAGEGVRVSPEAAREAEDEESNVIDLMAVLKRSLQAEAGGEEPVSADVVEADKSAEALRQKNRKELYELARELDIAGRSSMSRDQLLDAIRHSS